MNQHPPVWQSPPPHLSLTEDAVHVWRAGLHLSDEEFDQLMALLSADEQTRARRFHFDRDRRHFVAGRGRLRLILSRYLQCDPAQLQFCYGPFGKPALASSESQPLAFNLSHSHNLALYAVSPVPELGIDLEYCRALSDTAHLAERFFSAQEYQVIQSLEPPHQDSAFFRGWTRKEAYLKAIGDGLSQLQQVEVEIAPDQPPKLHQIAKQSGPLSAWSLWDLPIDLAYAAALAVKLPNPVFQYWQWPCERNLPGD